MDHSHGTSRRLSQLVEQLELAEYPSLRMAIAVLEERLDRELRLYADVYPELRRIEPLFGYLCRELYHHFSIQERVLFPEVRFLEQERRSLGAVKGPAGVLRWGSRRLALVAASLTRLASAGTRPRSLECVLADLRAFLDRVQRHARFEAEVLFPEAIQLERSSTPARPSLPKSSRV